MRRHERPRVAAEVRQIEAERFRQLLDEEGVGTGECFGIGGGWRQRRRREPVGGVTGTEPDERSGEGAAELLVPGKQLDLTPFCLRRWPEDHFAAPHEHGGADSTAGFGNEHESVGQTQLEVFGFGPPDCAL